LKPENCLTLSPPKKFSVFRSLKLRIICWNFTKFYDLRKILRSRHLGKCIVGGGDQKPSGLSLCTLTFRIFVGLTTCSTRERSDLVSVWTNNSGLPPSPVVGVSLKHLFQPFHPYNRFAEPPLSAVKRFKSLKSASRQCQQGQSVKTTSPYPVPSFIRRAVLRSRCYTRR
jgi:hypothetical protein